MLKPVIIDHDDSFTYILATYFPNAVVLNHKKSSVAEVESLNPTHLILSPGPGNPENPSDFAIGHELISAFEKRIPILGVCLGHQGIAAHYDARITHAPTPKHGRKSQITHSGQGIFSGISSPFTAMRYHSLQVENLPEILEVTAKSEDGVIMAFEHRELPIFGVQFHPESFKTEYGEKVIENFLGLV
jgi:anthranilate synthase/aminodeoxychorismate synthase-like glutamine amidotransferase